MNHGNTVNMAGLMQGYLPPLPELEDESYIPPWRDENNDEDEGKDKNQPCHVLSFWYMV